MAVHSAEEVVEDYFKQQLAANGVRYYTKTDPVNDAVERALQKAESKSGGTGRNYPDIKVMLTSANNRNIPVMMEVKGTKGRLLKLDKSGRIELERSDGKRNAITDFAVNGAVHYVNAILDGGEYHEALAVGLNGWEERGELKTEFGIYYISEDNAREPKLLAQYKNLSCLAAPNLNKLFDELNNVNLTAEERENLKTSKHRELERRVKDIHQSIYDDDDLKTALNTEQKLYFFSGLIMAGLPVDGDADFSLDDLKSNRNESDHDGIRVLTRVKSFLNAKHSHPDKIEMILNLLSPVFKSSVLWVPRNGESKIKTIYRKIFEDVIPILKLRLNVDFTGIILNSLKDWMELENDKKNDVVLTPRHVTDLMAGLCRTDMNSFVWDTAMGSGGFLLSAMELMIEDVKRRIATQQEREDKIRHIKENQLLGIEILGNIYILAVINMILSGDGSTHIYQQNSFDYQIPDNFPFNVFLLNPPYSAPGKGLNFVERALKYMHKGYGAVLIQENAGSGNGQTYAADILKRNTLLASIHMPLDLFSGRSSVQTAIYLFKVNQPHNPDDLVTFIDFSEDGYLRQNRKKSSIEVNLQDVDHAKERYKEIEAIVLGKKKETNYYNEENGTVIRDTITLKGDDWTFAQHKKIDITPTEEDFKQTVKDYLAWKVSQIIQNSDTNLGKP